MQLKILKTHLALQDLFYLRKYEPNFGLFPLKPCSIFLLPTLELFKSSMVPFGVYLLVDILVMYYQWGWREA